MIMIMITFKKVTPDTCCTSDMLDCARLLRRIERLCSSQRDSFSNKFSKASSMTLCHQYWIRYCTCTLTDWSDARNWRWQWSCRSITMYLTAASCTCFSGRTLCPCSNSTKRHADWKTHNSYTLLQCVVLLTVKQYSSSSWTHLRATRSQWSSFLVYYPDYNSVQEGTFMWLLLILLMG